MGKRTGNPRGRPPKPEGQKFVVKAFSFEPDAWNTIAEYVPEGARSAVAQRALLEEAERRKPECQPIRSNDSPAGQTSPGESGEGVASSRISR